MIHRVAKGLIDRSVGVGGAGNVSHLSVLRVDVVPLCSLFSAQQLENFVSATQIIHSETN